jgi:hypothetical protein
MLPSVTHKHSEKEHDSRLDHAVARVVQATTHFVATTKATAAAKAEEVAAEAEFNAAKEALQTIMANGRIADPSSEPSAGKPVSKATAARALVRDALAKAGHTGLRSAQILEYARTQGWDTKSKPNIDALYTAVSKLFGDRKIAAADNVEASARVYFALGAKESEPGPPPRASRKESAKP